MSTLTSKLLIEDRLRDEAPRYEVPPGMTVIISTDMKGEMEFRLEAEEVTIPIKEIAMEDDSAELAALRLDRAEDLVFVKMLSGLCQDRKIETSREKIGAAIQQAEGDLRKLEFVHDSVLYSTLDEDFVNEHKDEITGQKWNKLYSSEFVPAGYFFVFPAPEFVGVRVIQQALLGKEMVDELVYQAEPGRKAVIRQRGLGIINGEAIQCVKMV